MENLKHIGPKGSGYFCNVALLKDEKSGAEFAIKQLKKKHYPNEEYRYRLTREIQLLKELKDCEYIIELLSDGEDVDKQRLWYLMPYAKQNLFEFIRVNNSTLSKEERYKIMEQIIQAIQYAHERDILHRDISPSNVMVFDDEGEIKMKVSDFGLGKNKESLSHYTTSSVAGYGQIFYVSPEQREKLKEATAKSDIYSLGKLVYFVFTGKDPQNMQHFELSTLVNKATQHDPEKRFENIQEFYAHFKELKEIHLNSRIPVEYMTLRDYAKNEQAINWLEIHQLLVNGTHVEHVYSDYIAPVMSLLKSGDNLKDYYAAVEDSFLDFVQTFSDRLDECFATVGWPFNEASSMASFLGKIIRQIEDDEVRLICFKQYWNIAFQQDQWSAQKQIKELLTSKYISESMQVPLADYIINASVDVEMKGFNDVPPRIKAAILQGKDKEVKRKEAQEAERRKRIEELY